jgi:hypothetical protein
VVGAAKIRAAEEAEVVALTTMGELGDATHMVSSVLETENVTKRLL